ncbi:hypothetical protein QBC46DRAFT_337822 [Diplogelasinospora grovesii]|uniref:Epoxide hydrolase N-terminal domain-containing protein n=1 Tax=Diplogelasinospora grovesii TaxID=303347 RepID=A0AAN6NE30_9PEZI|nr:hypothetical protein QBC46DRAFT_337822 [Diplogelasinospora grovesii]
MHIFPVVDQITTLISATSVYGRNYDPRPLTIDLSEKVPRMLDLVGNTRLPDKPLYSDPAAGIGLGMLKSLQSQWTGGDFDWQKEQASLNQFNHFTAKTENQN